MTADDVRARLERERRRLEQLHASVLEETVPPGPDELSAADQHPADLGTETFEQAKDISIIAHLEAQLVEVDRALERVADGTYGRCEACGRPIGDERLEARPATRFCLDDQALAERDAAAGSGV